MAFTRQERVAFHKKQEKIFVGDGSPSVNELKETLLSRSKQHRNGQPRAQTAGSTASNTMSDYEKEQSAFFELRRKHYGKAE